MFFMVGWKIKDNANYSWPNTTRYRNDNYDKILEQALITSDKDERFKLYEKAESILMNDVPVIILWYPEVYNIRYGHIHNLFFNEMLHFDFSTYLFEFIMFGLFKKKSEKDILLEKYKKLTEEAYKLSHYDRKKAIKNKRSQ